MSIFPQTFLKEESLYHGFFSERHFQDIFMIISLRLWLFNETWEISFDQNILIIMSVVLTHIYLESSEDRQMFQYSKKEVALHAGSTRNALQTVND